MSKTTHSRPSDLIGVSGRWAAYQFDAAVSTFGVVIDNAAQERVKVGEGADAEWRNRYTLAELLTPGFVLESAMQIADDDIQGIRGMDGIIYDEIR